MQHDGLDLNLDLDRYRRRGQAEAVFGAGKTTPEILAAAERLLTAQQPLLVTRASDDALQALAQQHPTGTIWQRGGCFTCNVPEKTSELHIAIVSGGTSDAPVVDECAATLTATGIAHKRYGDCGVAGLQRLLPT